jgi:hypothetical protein
MDPVVVPARAGGASWLSTSARPARASPRIGGGDGAAGERGRAIGFHVAAAFAVAIASFYAGARYGGAAVGGAHGPFAASARAGNNLRPDAPVEARPVSSAVNCSASCPVPSLLPPVSCTVGDPTISASPTPSSPSTAVSSSPSPIPSSAPAAPAAHPPSPSLPWCTEGDLGGSWVHLEGSETAVPLVDYGWDSRNVTTKPPLAYGPDGLDFSSNGQGGSAPFMRHEPNEMLQWRWVPKGCALRNLTKREVQRMIGGLWIHLDGDSLQRDIYFDIAEALDGDNFQRVKAHEDISYGLPDGTLLTMGWNPAFKPNCDGAPWAGKHPTKIQPDIHIYNTGLWECVWRR